MIQNLLVNSVIYPFHVCRLKLMCDLAKDPIHRHYVSMNDLLTRMPKICGSNWSLYTGFVLF